MFELELILLFVCCCRGREDDDKEASGCRRSSSLLLKQNTNCKTSTHNSSVFICRSVTHTLPVVGLLGPGQLRQQLTEDPVRLLWGQKAGQQPQSGHSHTHTNTSSSKHWLDCVFTVTSVYHVISISKYLVLKKILQKHMW